MAQNHTIRHVFQWNLSSNTTVSVKNSSLRALNYFDENGLICIRGRLRWACLPEATKNPIVLHTHPLLVRIIQHYYLRMMHASAQLTLAFLKNEYWTQRSCSTVRLVLHKCIRCMPWAHVCQLMDSWPRESTAVSYIYSYRHGLRGYDRLSDEDINSTRSISCYSYVTKPRLYLVKAHT